jgi:hypothetical protein
MKNTTHFKQVPMDKTNTSLLKMIKLAQNE